MGQPFAQVPLVHARRGSELHRRHRTASVEGLVETQGITDAYQRNACRAAEIGEYLSHELMQVRVIAFSISIRPIPHRLRDGDTATRPILTSGGGPVIGITRR
jgi:hypothetical protein